MIRLAWLAAIRENVKRQPAVRRSARTQRCLTTGASWATMTLAPSPPNANAANLGFPLCDASSRAGTKSCRAACVKSFGRRRRTKVSEERTRGSQTMVYGYFCFRLSLAKSRPAVGVMGRDAICATCCWVRWLWR
jgi:hypothetical protein